MKLSAGSVSSVVNALRRRPVARLRSVQGYGNGGGPVIEGHDGVVVYWRPMCTYCMKLRLRLRFTRLRYTKVNIWRDPEAAAFVRSVADGNETVPTVTVAG